MTLIVKSNFLKSPGKENDQVDKDHWKNLKSHFFGAQHQAGDFLWKLVPILWIPLLQAQRVGNVTKKVSSYFSSHKTTYRVQMMGITNGFWLFLLQSSVKLLDSHIVSKIQSLGL